MTKRLNTPHHDLQALRPLAPHFMFTTRYLVEEV